MTSSEWDVLVSLPGWCSQAKAVHLQRLVGQLAGEHREPIRCAEVGVFGGRSLLAIALGLRDRGLGGYVLGIDPYSAEVAAADAESESGAKWWGAEDLSLAEKKCREAIRSLRLDPWCGLAIAQGHAVAPLLSGLALAHIDGAHSTEAALRDAQSFLPAVRPGGMIVLDDTDWESVAPAGRWLEQACNVVSKEPTYTVYRKREL